MVSQIRARHDGQPADGFGSRQRRMRAGMEDKVFSECQHGEVVRLDDLMQYHPMSNADHAVQDLNDILHPYYKVALKRFIDSLRMQAADYYLITGSQHY